jgi:hypothetical protein
MLYGNTCGYGAQYQRAWIKMGKALDDLAQMRLMANWKEGAPGIRVPSERHRRAAPGSVEASHFVSARNR